MERNEGREGGRKEGGKKGGKKEGGREKEKERERISKNKVDQRQVTPQEIPWAVHESGFQQPHINHLDSEDLLLREEEH